MLITEEVTAGDILPAKEAVSMIEQVDLGPTIDIPANPPPAIFP